MKKCTILLLMLLCLHLGLTSQTLPVQDIVTESIDSTKGKLNPKRILVAKDGGFITVGSDKDHGFIMRTSSCGKTSWTKRYLLGNETLLNSVVETPSGEIVATGSCRNCSPGDTMLKVLVIKTDANGQLMKDTTLGNFNFNAAGFDVITTNAANVAITGYVDFLGFLTPSDAFLAVLDPALKLQIWKTYNQTYRDLGKSLIQTADGGFAIAGYSIPAFLKPTQAQLFKTNAAGTLLWKNQSTHKSSEFKDIQQAADGKLVALGDRHTDDVNKRDVFLAVHMTSTGINVQQMLYGSTANDFGNSLEKIQGGFLVGAIYGQPSQPNYSTRDWVFWLDAQFNKTDDFFRDSYLFGHSLRNAVPLSGNGQSFAYHSVRNLYGCNCPSIIFFNRNHLGNHAELTQAPSHYQLVPRDLTSNQGTVKFSGTVSDVNTYDAMQLDIRRDGIFHSSLQSNTPLSFQFDAAINAELAEYSFRLYGIKNQVQALEAEVCAVVAGDAYFIQGQSNAVADLPFWDTANVIDHAYRHDTSVFIRNFGLKYSGDTQYTWHREARDQSDYADKISGQWGLVLAKKIVDTYGIPVAIINGAISGISIDNMMPDDLDHSNLNTSYGRFLKRVELSGLKSHIRAKFMFQGETNAAGWIWDDADEYFQKFEQLDNAWKQDFPAVHKGYVFQIRPGGYSLGATLLTCLEIEEAQRRFAASFPDWNIMSSTGMNHDGLHYHYNNGYERAGDDIFRLIAHDFHGASNTTNIYPPSAKSVHFSNCNRSEIAIKLQRPNDTYYWTPGWESDFQVMGTSNVSVTSGHIIGDILYLTLSGTPPANGTNLRYASHPNGDQAPLKNANGIGMLTFLSLQVEPCNPLAAAEASPGAIKVDDIEIIGDGGNSNGSISVAVMGGVFPYTYLWNTGATSSNISGLASGTYSLSITDANMCNVSFEFEVAMTSATTAPLNGLEIKTYPNPCTDYLYIRLPEKSAGIEYNFVITDLLGRELLPLFEPQDQLSRINTASFVPGTYILTLLKPGKPSWSRVFLKN